MTVEEWLNGTQLSIDIFNKKYKNNNESFEEFLDRVSHGYEPVKQLIKEKKFLFGGRILASRGISNRKVTYSNCYVISPPDDNIESIFECASKLARTYSFGGKITTLPPYTVMYSKKFSEPTLVGCIFKYANGESLKR